MCNVLCAMCYVQCAMRNVLCAMCSVDYLFVIYNICKLILYIMDYPIYY